MHLKLRSIRPPRRLLHCVNDSFYVGAGGNDHRVVDRHRKNTARIHANSRRCALRPHRAGELQHYAGARRNIERRSTGFTLNLWGTWLSGGCRLFLCQGGLPVPCRQNNRNQSPTKSRSHGGLPGFLGSPTSLRQTHPPSVWFHAYLEFCRKYCSSEFICYLSKTALG